MSSASSLFTPPAAGRTPDPSLAHRRASAVLTVSGQTDAHWPGPTSPVEQTSHWFLFGCIGFDLIGLAKDAPQDQK
jgi:hypothetical protein